MPDLLTLLEHLAERGDPAGPDAVYERAMHTRPPVLGGGGRRAQDRKPMVRILCVAAAALIVLTGSVSLWPSDDSSASPCRQARGAAFSTPTSIEACRFPVVDQSTGEFVANPLGIGWVPSHWPL